jgi:hypothetical protein
MTTRDQLVKDLKERLDAWNAEAAKWEGRASKAREDTVDRFDKLTEEARYQLRLLEGASAAAYDDAAKGAQEAWEALAEAFEKARAHFEKRGTKTRA